jgi:hypothetical protein
MSSRLYSYDMDTRARWTRPGVKIASRSFEMTIEIGLRNSTKSIKSAVRI